ncbi:MAG: hypothetical protein KDE34_23730, partial [Anaerolineales bacterium]|nr:hypothetical protein [Anaerolineales bacterium]
MPNIRRNIHTCRQIAGWLILLFSIAGCQSLEEIESIEPTAAPVTTLAVPDPSTIAATSAPATATLIPTVTNPPTLTPIPSPTFGPTFDAAPCIPHEPADLATSSTPLQIEYTIDTETFRWSEATGETIAVDRWAPFAALPAEALAPVMSPDETKVVYGEQMSEDSFGLYLLPAGATTATFLTDFSAPEVLTRNEWAGWLELRLAWFGGSDRFTYHAEPAAEGLGDPPYEELYLFDLNTDASSLLLPAIQAQGFVVDAAFTQLIAPVSGALHLVDLGSG